MQAPRYGLRDIHTLCPLWFQYFHIIVIFDLCRNTCDLAMACRIVRNLKAGNHMAVGINRPLDIVADTESLIGFHKSCIRDSKGNLFFV